MASAVPWQQLPRPPEVQQHQLNQFTALGDDSEPGSDEDGKVEAGCQQEGGGEGQAREADCELAMARSTFLAWLQDAQVDDESAAMMTIMADATQDASQMRMLRQHLGDWLAADGRRGTPQPPFGGR